MSGGSPSAICRPTVKHFLDIEGSDGVDSFLEARARDEWHDEVGGRRVRWGDGVDGDDVGMSDGGGGGSFTNETR
ncbi:MAG: hypothetical protein R3B96_06575 [Pirellulaceae bacterium]